MLGDTEIQPSEITPTPLQVGSESSQEIPPVYIPRKKSPLGLILLGFFLVVFLSGVFGVVYFKAKFSASSPSPSPSPTTVLVSAEPTIEPTPTPSATPKTNIMPVSAIKITTSPTPTPTPEPSLDIRFGNPSVSIKQTIDEGLGDGRVINREYSSIQVGEFDEVPSRFSPRVTVCFHMVANVEVPGKDIKYSLSVDDKIKLEDNMSWIDKFEPGRIYDWCHDVTTDIGHHTAKLLLNPAKSVKEFNYVNDLARLEWVNLADKIAPNFTIGGPFDWGDEGTCFVTYTPSDNVNTVTELKIEQKVDSDAWSSLVDGKYCFKGASGSTHTYVVRMTDVRGNINEQNKSFNLF
ncbi:MAG: hypothetical protein ABII21_02590 [bacterium]